MRQNRTEVTLVWNVLEMCCYATGIPQWLPRHGLAVQMMVWVREKKKVTQPPTSPHTPQLCLKCQSKHLHTPDTMSL